MENLRNISEGGEILSRGIGISLEKEGRRYQELDLGPHASGWVIHWEPGHDTGWHDHGGSSVTIVCVSGRLREEYGFSPNSGVSRTLVPGQTVTLTANELHRVLPDVKATAIHIYTPKLEVMNIFDNNGFVESQTADKELNASR